MKNISKKATEKTIYYINSFFLLVIFLEIILKFILVIKHRIGWDEFYFLSILHSYKRHELTQPFQSFHVHLLGWVPGIAENEVIQIIASRCFLFLLFIASGVFLYLIAREFLNRGGALFSVFCWLSFSNIINHGASLRADSFCTFFFLLACFALLRPNWTRLWTAIAGIAMGLSVLVSIKAIIHLASLFALLGILFLSSHQKKTSLNRIILFITFLALTFGFGFGIHRETLAPTTLMAEQDFISRTSSQAKIFDEFFPKLGYFADTIRKNMITWWLLGVGVFYSILDLKRVDNKKALVLLPFLIPLLSLPFYRNAFPYYYFFIIAPAILFCGFLPHRILQGFQNTGSKFLLLPLVIICLPIAGSAGFHYFKAFNKPSKPQTEILSVIHKMFPDPVPYIDGCSAVSSYPKVGFFMSNWGFENYYATGRPIFRKILQEQHPQFILADTPHLDFRLQRNHTFFEINHDFFEMDKQVLENNYIRYWGMIWLPGKTLHTLVAGKQQTFEILIPGPYVVESSHSVFIDKMNIKPGEKTILTSGNHLIEAQKHYQNIVLRWDKIKYRPTTPPPEISTFYGF